VEISILYCPELLLEIAADSQRAGEVMRGIRSWCAKTEQTL